MRVLLAYLGGEAPLLEEDVRLLASRSYFSGARVINYLRLTGRLVPDRSAHAHLVRARRAADDAPGPFRPLVHRWIDVLCGQASQPSWPLAPSTVSGYVRLAAPVLYAWYADGVTDLRAITRSDVETALQPKRGHAAVSLATALRSLFRALKREKLIFRDPARGVSTASAVTLPRPLPDDRLRGALDRMPSVHNQLTFVLAAVHALSSHDQRHLLLDDLDLSRGTLLVRRRGKLDHTLYLDDLTFRLARLWRAERHRRWPTSTNPYLLVTVCTAVDDTHPAVNPQAITKPLRQLGLQVGRLRMDRILDEAKHTADPVHLIRLFGLSPCTAMQYVRAAHPYGGGPSPL
ncbi:hypothetical protein [Streptomyces sp. BRA346]|uniref:hypothetical protein n=1 Tax=Streptomyces sp. BRA346 TaxID=2878199 RepID=UPI0040648C9E